MRVATVSTLVLAGAFAAVAPAEVVRDPAPGPAMAAAAPEAGEREGSSAATEPFLAALNRERELLGLPALRWSEELARAAQTHADDMVRKGYQALSSPEGLTIDDWVAEAGYEPQILAEKVAGGWLRPETWVEGWAEYPEEHRRSVFHPEVLALGVGKVRYGDAPLYVLVLGRSQADDLAARQAEAATRQAEELARLAAAVADLEAARERVVAELNAARRETGGGRLRRHPTLERLAQERAEALVAGAPVQDAPTRATELLSGLGRSMYRVRAMVGLEEISARGPLSPDAVAASWLDDSGYREAVLKKAFTEIGVGAEVAPAGEIVWVAILTRPRF
ncbi:MAG TPA: CAP domain-containing protein [Thermoanaerobaculia bacterium]|nr:CAP domain-containing protein [Thermoanaerobaculia bacterium]